MMRAQFELRTLGVPRLLAEGREVRVHTRKHMALLVYLAVEPSHAERRDFLIELLWPDSAYAHGRQSLATALSSLRARLGRDTLKGEGNRVRLRAECFHLDLERLEAADVLGDGDWPLMEVDGFLAGFEVDAPEFQIWRDRQRARLLPALEHALILLADHARRTADLARLGRTADRLLALNELSEVGMRARMEAHALGGDRITAVRIYDAWAERLSAELGARPSAGLDALAMRLRLRGLDRPPASAPASVRTEHWLQRPFVGRAREYRVLYELWETMALGRPRHCLIQGDSGVGKTTLADRLATAVALEGASVARVRCFDLERGIPYATLGGAVELLLDRPGAAATDPQSLAEIGRVVPAVRQRFANLPQPVEIQGEAARIRFAEAVLDFLTALMDEHPVVLIVDDFPLSDDVSLSVLHLLMRRLAEKPFMVVFTARVEFPQDAPNARRIRNGAGYLGMTVMELEPMPRPDMEQLLELLARDGHPQPGPSERRMLLRTAAGYPLALELLFRDWQARGAQSVAVSLGAMTAEVVENPDAMYKVLAEGLVDSLDSATRMTLDLAAVLDRRLNELEMYALVDQTPAQAMVCLARLVQARAMRDRGTGLEFINPGMRGQAYLGTPISLRRTLHTGVADRLLEREQAGERIPGLEIAWHCVRSGRTHDVAPYLVRGAREAIDDGAPHEAELALSSGIGLLDGELLERGHLLWAEALQELGRWRQSQERLAVPRGSKNRDTALTADLLGLWANAGLEAFTQQQLSEVINRLDNLIRTEKDGTVRALALGIAAPMCETLRDPTLSATLRDSSGSVSLQGLTPVDMLRVLLAKAMLAYHCRDLFSAAEGLREAQMIAEQHGIRNSLLLRLLNGRGVLATVQGDYHAATTYYTRLYDLARRLDNDHSLRRAANNLALCWYRLGDVDRQYEWAHRLVASDPTGIDSHLHVDGRVLRGSAEAVLGRRRDAKQSASELTTYGNHESPWVAQRALCGAADIYWLLGARERALTLGARATTGKHDSPATVALTGPFTRWLAVTLHYQGRDLSSRATVIAKLRRIVKDRARLDAIDAVEALASLELVDGLPDNLRTELAIRLGALPRAALDGLLRLGLPSRIDAPEHVADEGAARSQPSAPTRLPTNMLP